MDATPGWCSSWLDGLDDATIDSLFRLGQRRNVSPGFELTTAGARGHELVIVLAGSGRVVSGGRVLARLGRGAFIGEMFLDARPHATTVVAESPLDMLVLDASGFRSLLGIPSAIHELCRQLVARLRHAGTSPRGAPPFELRAVAAGDLEGICALANRASRHDGVAQVLTIEELAESLASGDLDLESDTRVAVIDGEIAGWSYVRHPSAEVRLDRAHLIGDVDPERRGQGIGTALLGWSLDRALERFERRAHDLPKRIWVSAYEWMDTNRRLLAKFGFAPVRWYDELIRPLTDLPAVLVPEGVVLLAWVEDRDEELRDVRNAAFADHWGSEPLDSAMWREIVHGHGGRPDLSVFAVDVASGAVVGMCANQAYPEDEALTGRREAWIHDVATLAPWRGRGIASAMVAWSLAAFDAAGFTHAVLTVDADSPTDAGRLYRALGFEPLRRSILHELAVP